jgi:phosphatidylinositol-3-phosphatase
VADRNDDQIPGQAGPAGDDVPTSKRGACEECGTPLAPDQRYCLSCGARRGRLPGAVAGTVAALSSKGKAAAKGVKGKDDGGKDGDGGGWSWMPSPPAIAIAVIGMLALGVGLGSAMSEIASSAPLSTILLEYPSHATEAPPPAEEPEEEEFAEEEAEFAEAPEEAALPEEIVEEPLPEEVVEEPLLPEEATKEPEAEENPFEDLEKLEEREKEEEEAGGTLPEVRHAFLIVLGEGGYDETFGAASGAPYLSRVLPKKGELLPNYYGVTSGVLANEIALLSGQGPTPETAVDCPNYAPIAPGTVSVFAAQVEGNGCVYGKEVESLPTQLEEKELTWRAYVQDMENGGAIGQPWRCRKPVLGESDTPVPSPEDLYVNWRNPVVYFSAIAESDECEKHDVGFELLTKDLGAKKKTPTLSLIFPEASSLKTLVPAIMASPAYQEGGMIMITSAQAPQADEGIDQKSCCLAPEYPNLPLVAGATPPTGPEPEEAEPTTGTTPTKYTEESVLETGGGGKVGLLMISPFVEAGKVEETEYANHFTLLKTLEAMLGVEPIGYAAEEEMPALSAELFIEPPVTGSPRSEAESPAPAGPPQGTS